MGNIILILSVALPVLVVLACLLMWRWWRNQDRRRSPLNLKVINLPGEGLRKRIAKHSDSFDEAMAMAVTAGPIVLSAWLIARMSRVITDWTKIRFGAGDAILGAFLVLLVAWSIWRLIRHAGSIRKYRDGLVAELAVAQCLAPLAAEGALIFHDFPGDSFNIDHIVVGHSAVFAIETKSRKKPADGGRDSAKVAYDGSRLKFPAHFETKPVQQTAFQAKWLEQFLASGVGEAVRVVPVLALPGWYIENLSARPEVFVSNCRNPSFMLSGKFGPLIDAGMRKRIAHVLSERYSPIDI